MDEKSTSRKFTRREFLRAAGITAAGAVIASCTPAPEPTNAPVAGAPAAPAAKPTIAPANINLMAFGQADVPPFDATIKQFMAVQDKIKVQVTFAPNDETYYTKIQTQIAGGAQPEIVSMQGWGFQPFADTKTIVALDDWIKRDNFSYAWPQLKAVTDYAIRDGKTWLMPMQLATMVMFYSKKLFDEAGVKYPTDDWTYEQFIEIAQKLTKPVGGKKQFGYQANGNWFRDIHWIRGTGKQEFDTLVEPKKSTFNQPEIVKIIQEVASDFFFKSKISPTPADLDAGSGSLNAGSAAMKYEGPWFFSQMSTPKLRDEKKDVPFDVVLMPKQQDAKRPHRGWVEGVVIMKTDAVREAASWECLKFMGGEEGQKIFSKISGRMPNNPALVESYYGPIIKQEFGVENYKALVTGFNNGVVDVVCGMNRAQFWNEAVKPIGWDPLLANKATAAEVLPKVDQAVQKMLDDYWAKKPK
jgi:multiple sugar transport system substrate-binding protein